MKTLLLNFNDDETEASQYIISDGAFEQIGGECPIIRVGAQTFTYSDVSGDLITYNQTREFTVTHDVETDEVSIFETADPDNVL